VERGVGGGGGGERRDVQAFICTRLVLTRSRSVEFGC